jgi:small subunit ribosomal protein S20
MEFAVVLHDRSSRVITLVPTLSRGQTLFGRPLLATHKSAAKRARQSVRKNARNKRTMNSVRTLEKKIRGLMAGGKGKEAQELVSEYMSSVGKAAAKGVVKAKTASRKIGRIASRISGMVTGAKK